MDFRILGPFEVVGEDGPLDLRGAKRRGLTALLAVHAGQWLATDRIVEELWGDEPSSGAAHTVQTYVSQLRRTLDGTQAKIPQRDGSYRLEVPLDRVDAWQFEQDVRRATDTTDASERLRALDDALARWRGTPLDEFDQPWADRERARLQLLQLQALDAQIDARLAVGQDHGLVAPLEALVAEHPLDERFWAKLVVAYYRAGRQADALGAFQRVRSTLAQELGIDPGPELVQLEQRILQQDESLLGPTPPTTARTSRPTGTVTFLFVDMADSTRLWEEHPDVMPEVIARYHALLTRVIEQGNGHVVKTIGDGLMAVFAEAPAAVAAAVGGQLAIAAADWPIPLHVRMGLHTGAAHLIDGDYHAPTVNRAARISGAAHPDQILLSDSTAALCERTTARDLGEHHLRGLAPMRLHQVVASGLRQDFPTSHAALVLRLPVPPTSFIGRDEELETVLGQVHDHRLVTLTGAGGCGKTRLALEVAARLASTLVDGVRFVDLAPISRPEGVDEAVIDALGIPIGYETLPSRDRVVSYLADRRMLVILDNCEHLLDACAELVEGVLGAPGSCKVLTTSREALGVPAEQVLRVPSLDPDTDAMTLFVERARAARGDFVADETTRADVRDLCGRLDGIPLAIELAAARTTHLSPGQMLDRLDDRFRLLTGGRRRIQRQQTLAATLDWSHDLLDQDEREVLRRLAAFPAGFSLEAAEAVVDRDDVIERLGSLVAKSLVQTVDDAGRLRYRLLESVRLYAEAKLVDAGEADSTRTRHARWTRDWLESIPLERRLLGDDDVLSTEPAGVHAAIEWAVATGDVDTAAAVASGVDWSRTEGWPEGFRTCELLLREQGISEENRLRLALMLWWLAPIQRWAFDGARVWPMIDQAAKEKGPLAAMARSAAARDLIIPSIVARDEEAQQRAADFAEDAVVIGQDAPQGWRMYYRMIAGMTHASFRRPDRAAEHFAAERAPDGPYSILDSSLVPYHAIMRFVMGDDEQAVALARASHTPELSPYWSHARPISLVALAATGDVATARRALREYAVVAREAYWVYGVESVVMLGGVLAGVEEDWPSAARLLSAGSQGVRRTPADSLLYFTFRDRARDALGSDTSRRMRDEGRAMPIEHALELALG